ncbi:MAG: sigma-70 family RNA polymerase sigma factor [bacterium]|nr:sigma-70 family RNA polymerase sigma factor [bacterium]
MKQLREIDNQTHDLLKDEEVLSISLKNPSAFALLVDRYQMAFIKAAYKIVKNKEESEDIVQEAFTKIYLNAGKFREVENATFKSWAYKIVRNVALNHYGKLKKDYERYGRLDDAPAMAFADNSMEKELIREEAAGFVRKTLEFLPKQFESALKKYYIEDKSQKMIAEEEGITLATVKMRLFRARKIFKEKIKIEERQLSWII